ncbi:glycerophosphodiester phosphodiesterase [Nocardioides sp.]|uniref:glycerophosphodiester phosphodiesterase n=1 Tax=Nocardioides sp. TaxID=35761 RepID=UPI0039E3D400
MAMVSAHRVESPAALQAALALDVEFVELDVRPGTAGALVVAHDEPGLDSLDYVEALVAIAAAGKRAHLDLKTTGREIEAVDRAVALLGADRVVVTTGEDDSVRMVRAWAQHRHPDLLVGLSFGRSWEGLALGALVRQLVSELFPDRRMRESGANLVVAHRRLARLTVAGYASRRGLPLLVWTVDTDVELRLWLRRAWLVTTNRPEAALAIRSEAAAAG